jgi:acyl-CoA synthetase (AMP-forming)/AMP-acid ligase II
LAVALHVNYGVGSRQKVAIVCRNHAAAIKAIFAVSRLGAHLFLLNPEMSADQLLALADRLRFDFVIYDEPLAHVFKNAGLSHKSLPAYHPTDPSIDRLAATSSLNNGPLKKMGAGNIVVLTGGTTGQPKSASRKPSIFNYLPPFFAFLSQAHLDKYRSIYITTPICHGYGLAFLFIGIILGADIYVTNRFDAARACSLVASHKIQVMIVVPLILQRMLKLDPESLSSLQCIITGSAVLTPALAQETIEQLGPKLFNLYGSSEAGFCIIATPHTLSQKPGSIGKPIQGVQTKIVNGAGQEVGENVIGQLCIRSRWSSNRKSWIETGDLAYRDPDGDIFLCGRVDDMIISGGENVYPIELENILSQHPDIDSAAVFGIPDQEFGQRLKAVVIKKRDTALDQATLLDWLKPRVARYQMPAIIEFRDELPHTSVGKVDKKSLRG